MKSFLQRLLPQGPFGKGVAVLAAGTATSQAIAILSAPFLTRLYTPYDFGVLAVYAAVLGVMLVVAGLRYELAISLPVSDAGAGNVAALSLICVLIFAILTGALTLFFGDDFSKWWKLAAIARYLWLIPFGILFGGCYQVLNYWALRKKAFKCIANTKFSQSISSTVVSIAGGLFSIGALGLLLGQLLMTCAGLFGLVRNAYHNQYSVLSGIRISRIFWAAKKYRHFAGYSTLSGLICVLGGQLPIIIIGVYFTPASAGFYFLADKVLRAPINLIGNSIGQVFLAHVAEKNREGNLGIFALSLYKKLCRMGVPTLVIFSLVAPQIFLVVFGSNWEVAGQYARWIALYMAAEFIVAPLSSVEYALEKQKVGLLFQMVLALSRVGAIGLGVFYFDEVTTIAIYSIVCMVFYLVYGAWAFNVMGVKFADWTVILLAQLIWLMPLAVIFYGFNYLFFV